MRDILRNRRSFTILEVITVILLMGIFSYGVALYVTQVVDSWKFLIIRYQQEQNGRLAIDFIVRDLRAIDINSLGRPQISSASAQDISFTDTNSMSISYSYSNNVIYKNSQPLVKDVSNLEIRYYRDNNAEIAPLPGGSLSSGQIRQIWYLYVRFVLTEGDQTSVYSSYIFPRNFLIR